MKKISLIATALAGAISGAVMGILYAPVKGSSTREKIYKERDKYVKALKEEVEEIRALLSKRAGEAKIEMDELHSRAESKRKSLLKEAKKVTSYEEWTKKELYERAKEKNIERYSLMDKAELIEALRNQ